MFRPPFVSRVQDMVTYAIKSPVSTHFRPAGCAEVDCSHHLHGWDSIVDESVGLGQAQAGYIRRECVRIVHGASTVQHPGGTRRYVETQRQNELGGVVTVFHFPAGQRCFTEHQVPVGRPEHFLRRAGDVRGNPDPRSARRYDRPDQWVDDFAGHQQRLADLQKEG
jgi:hypothetical protein